MKQVQVKKTGYSFQPESKIYFDRELKPVNFQGKEYTTAAQLMTVIGYGDSNGIPCRSLDYCVKCEDFADLMRCIEIINSYNDFEADRIKKYSFWRLNLQHYLNTANPNNGKQLFDFYIARECSPAFYVKYNGKYNNFIIKDTEQIPATETQEAGKILYFEEYTEADFRENMTLLSSQIGADEFSIKTTYTYQTGENCLEARFWFD